MKRLFHYIEPIWLGTDNKMSLRAVLAIAFSIDFINNLSYAIQKWSIDRSLEGLSLVLGIEGSLIVSLLGIAALTNVAYQKMNAGVTDSSTVKVQTEKTVTHTSKKQPTDNFEKDTE